ncbi:MAG: Gfo/Idh/MocA family oxidoreductase [Oscillospiraceae bacterium]|nr:Gfo/Idh/MocA family oxidoreductase [Oscillospiraceae bacterium]
MDVSILLVGVGGYGKNYVDALFSGAAVGRGGRRGAGGLGEVGEVRRQGGAVRVVGAVEISAAARAAAEEIATSGAAAAEAVAEEAAAEEAAAATANGAAGAGAMAGTGAVSGAPAGVRGGATSCIPFYDSIGAFYAEKRADLAILSTPIHLHCEQIIQCLQNGSHVLCEKPLCATVDEAAAITKAATAAGRHVWVGYQMSFSDAVLALKDDIMSGAFGKPLMFKTIVHYPRDEAYYARNNWAGLKRSGDGRLILDSPVHNAVAHHLNNMLFLLGGAADRAAQPKTVQAELYRGNPDVDNFDTAALRCMVDSKATDSGVPVLFYTTHCLPRAVNIGPINQYRFEHATIVHTDERVHDTFIAMLDDGTTRRYAPPPPGQTGGPTGGQMKKLWDCIEAVRGGPVPPGGADAAIAEVLCVNGAQLSHPILTIPPEYVRRVGDMGKRFTDVEGLEKMLFDCYDSMLLPSELGDGLHPPWTVAGKIIEAPEITNISAKI